MSITLNLFLSPFFYRGDESIEELIESYSTEIGGTTTVDLENAIREYYENHHTIYPTLAFLCRNFICRIINGHALPGKIISRFMEWLVLENCDYFSLLRLNKHHTVSPCSGTVTEMTGRGLLKNAYTDDSITNAGGGTDNLNGISLYFMNLGYFKAHFTPFLTNNRFAQRCVETIISFYSEYPEGNNRYLESVDILNWLGDDEYKIHFTEVYFSQLEFDSDELISIVGERFVFDYPELFIHS